MSKYLVKYDHEIVITYEAVVEADSVEEAREKMENMDFETETEIDYQGMSVNVLEVERIED